MFSLITTAFIAALTFIVGAALGSVFTRKIIISRTSKKHSRYKRKLNIKKKQLSEYQQLKLLTTFQQQQNWLIN